MYLFIGSFGVSVVTVKYWLMEKKKILYKLFSCFMGEEKEYSIWNDNKFWIRPIVAVNSDLVIWAQA